MDHFLRKTMLFVLIFFTLGFTVSKNAETIRVKFNEEFLPSSAGVMVKGNDVFMSYRLVGKYFGATTEGRSFITGDQGGCTIVRGDLKVEMQSGIAKATVNGEEVKLNAKPFVADFGKGSRHAYELMVPLESVAKIFSSEMKWDKKTNTVSVKTPKRKIVPFEQYYNIRDLSLGRDQKDNKEKVIFPEVAIDAFGYNAVHQGGRTYLEVKFGMYSSGGYSPIPQRVYFVEGEGYYVAWTMVEPYGVVTTALDYPGFVIGFENKEKLPVFVGMPKMDSLGKTK